MKTLQLFFISAMLVMLYSCKEDAQPDYLADSTGSYGYVSTTILMADRNQKYTDTGILTVYNESGKITLVFDQGTADEVSFSTRNVLVANNGYVFDIVPDSFTDVDGDTFTIRGTDSQQLDQVDYHGRYDSGSHQLYVTFVSDYDESEFDIFNQEYSVIATQK